MARDNEYQVQAFAEACFDDNSEAELREALRGEADATDCNVWHITPTQWRDAITLALEWMAEDI